METEKILKGIGGWIIVHTRATDEVFIGPFLSIDEASNWLVNEGIDRGVRGSIVPLVLPQCDRNDMWKVPALAVSAVYGELL